MSVNCCVNHTWQPISEIGVSGWENKLKLMKVLIKTMSSISIKINLLTFLNALRKFSDKKAYKSGLTQLDRYASTCDTIWNPTKSVDDWGYKSIDLRTSTMWIGNQQIANAVVNNLKHEIELFCKLLWLFILPNTTATVIVVTRFLPRLLKWVKRAEEKIILHTLHVVNSIKCCFFFSCSFCDTCFLTTPIKLKERNFSLRNFLRFGVIN
jgi:hypothetical protein